MLRLTMREEFPSKRIKGILAIENQAEGLIGGLLKGGGR